MKFTESVLQFGHLLSVCVRFLFGDGKDFTIAFAANKQDQIVNTASVRVLQIIEGDLHKVPRPGFAFWVVCTFGLSKVGLFGV